MNIQVYTNGNHYLKVVEVDDQARIEGLRGWIDSIELMSLLVANGYKLAM